MALILIVDDQLLLRTGLKLIIESARDLEAAAVSGAEAISEIRRRPPDIVLLDIQLQETDGFALLRSVLDLSDSPRVAVLTATSDGKNVLAALRMGAAGFISKNASPEELVAAVRALALGKTVLSPLAVSQLLSEVELGKGRSSTTVAARQLTDLLSVREHDVLVMMAEGFSNADIGRRLLLSTGTVKDYVSAILSKLHVANRVQAAVIAYHAGLLDQPSTANLGYSCAQQNGGEAVT